MMCAGLIESKESNKFIVADHHSLFDEHFKGFSIVPGAFSLGVCIRSVLVNSKETLGCHVYLQLIEKISFLRPVVPGVELNWKFNLEPAGVHVWRVRFELKSFVKGIIRIKEAK